MEKILMRAMESDKLTAMYVNKTDPEKFLVCKVLLVGESDTLTVLYDANTSLEALCFCPVDTIYRVEQDSRYLKQIQKKAKHQFAFPKFKGTPWDSFLQMQALCDNHISCYLYNGELINGIPIRYSINTLILSQDPNNAASESITCIDRNRIAMLTCGYKGD